MQKITPHLWLDQEAKAAALFYTSIFENTHFVGSTTIKDTPSGEIEIAVFELEGLRFYAMSTEAEAPFKLNASLSITVACTTEKEIDELWEALSQNGNIMMPLQAYPFAQKYGWVADRYGLSWQLMLQENVVPKQKMTISFLFAGDGCGRAEEAARFYTNLFPQAKILTTSYYSEGEAKSPQARVNYLSFTLEGQAFTAMDHGYGGEETFNEAFSILVHCKDQKEIDDLWRRLSADPENEACGWLKDRFGVSWQLMPEQFEKTLLFGSEKLVAETFKVFSTMKKPDIKKLEEVQQMYELSQE